MKKALTITIAGTLFTIEEDAYNALDAYLKSIQAHFGADPDKAEIVRDIETRIAEQLMERKGENNIVTIEAVEAMIAVMGTVSDFDQVNGEEHAADTAYEAKRRFFRNPDDMVIGGVCSGLAAYFGVDALAVRLVFVLLVLLGFGAGVVIYIILALVVPKAETPAEKLQMAGGPVTLNSFKENINEQIKNAKSSSTGILHMVDKLMRLFGRLVRLLFKVARLVFGLGFLLGAFFACIASTFALANAIVNAETIFAELPVLTLMTHSMYYSAAVAAYVVVLVPVLFIGATGLGILRRRKIINMPWATGLAAVWLVAVIALGTVAIHEIPRIHDELELSEDRDMAPIPPLPYRGS